jgi:hypothetical protein
MVYWDAGGTGDGPIDVEPMLGLQTGPRFWDQPVRQYRDVTVWLPKVRRFDQEQELRRKREAAEQAELKRLEAEAIDDDPDKPDAPRQQPEADRGADRPPQ